MAIAIPHPRIRTSEEVAPALPGSTLALALATPVADLLALLQRDGVFVGASLAFALLTAITLALVVAHRAGVAWLWAALLAYGASAVARLVGMDEAPLLGVLGLIALGLGGVFRDVASEPRLALVERPAQLATTDSLEFPRAA